jgi:hypothetical protein
MKSCEKLIFVTAPVMPLLIKIFYLPFDVFVTVRVLGCEGDGGFNANDFNNKIVMPISLIASLIILMVSSRKLSGWKKLAYRVLGGFLQVFLSLCWGMFIWM